MNKENFMRYGTIKEIQELYGYNRYQLQNLRKNGKVRFRGSPITYALVDIERAEHEDFVYETIMKSRSFNLGKYIDTKEIEEYMKIYGKEYKRVLFGMLKGKFNTSLNEYSKNGPLNSYDNRSLFMLAQGEFSRYLTSWKNAKDNFEKWCKGKSKKKINNRKLYLTRSYQKIKIKRKDFCYFIGDDDKINCRLMIKNGYLYTPSFDGKRRKRVFIGGYWGEGKQTVTITKNKNGKIICNVSYHVPEKKRKYKGTCGIDVNMNNLSVACVDNNGCLRKRKTFELGNIVNLRRKKVEIMKLLKEIRRWSKGYKPILEDLNLSRCYKNRKTSNIIYGQVRYNSFMLGNDVKFVKANYTSFIGLTKYSNLGMSKKHFGGSKDESAAMVIARRGLGFREKLPKFKHEGVEYFGKNYKQMNNWNYWSYLKHNYGEEGTRELFGF